MYCWSLSIWIRGTEANGRIREAVTDNLPAPASKSTFPRNVLSRRTSVLASVYRPMTSLIGTFGSGMLSSTILVSGYGSAASIRLRVACVATFPCTVTPDSSR